MGDARERKPFAGSLVRCLLHLLHLGTVRPGRHVVARFHHRRERRTYGIRRLLAEKAEKCSQEHEEGEPTFHEADMVGRGLAGVNDYPPCRA